MPAEYAYLGTWVQRTSLHLREVYNFFKDQQVTPGLDLNRGKKLWQNLELSDVTFSDRDNYESVTARCGGGIVVTFVEDGVITLRLPAEDFATAAKTLEHFYAASLGPALAYLFSRGAPLPKPLGELKTVHPFMFVTDRSEQREAFFNILNDAIVSRVSSSGLEICFGRVLQLFIYQRNKKHSEPTEEFIQNIVFFREFENQLANYLNLHRNIWEEVSYLREAGNLRYRDFSAIRQRIMNWLKTLFFVEARLKQMYDILAERVAGLPASIKEQLNELGLNRFDHLQANQLYVSHLWEMAIEYTKETMALLDSLFQENTQRELNALKFITFIAALTGFFGMNIAFPWEERWAGTAWSFYSVMALMAATTFIFYGVIRALIYNRKFAVKMPTKD